jgi:hypothetical protein
MATSDAPLFDAWTPLAFKRVLGNRETPGTTWGLPVWTGHHARRLMAYQMLQAFIDNAGRHFLTDPNEAVREQHREYGDAALIRDQVLSALLGETQQIVTERADEFDPNQEDEETADVDPDDPDVEPAEPDEPDEPDPEVEAAWAFQEWIRDWGDSERFPLKVIETERNSVGLGDGCYSVGWSSDKQRVRLRCWDPGFYFPVLGDGNEDDFPEKVHIAWELEAPSTGPDKDKVRIRRLTWELVDSAQPWNPAYQDRPATKTCLMSDGTFTLDLGSPENIEALTEANVKWADYQTPEGVFEWHNIDLKIDFIPVIHEPNTISLLNHYGRSSIAACMQILDDLANTDTDLQAASATTGNPVITIGGASLGNEADGTPKRLTYQPGEVIETGDGKMDTLDTSKSLTALIGYTDHLLDRLSVNARLPGSVLGRQDQKDIKSGIHLQLTFGPLSAMIHEMRLVREEKYPLLFKMVWRISKQSKAEGVPAEWQPTTLELGSFLPSDENAAIEMVKTLLSTKPLPAVSLETAVQILINAGLPIEDAAEEVRKIEERAFEAAVALLEALGDEEAVAEFLSREVPPEPVDRGVGLDAGGTPVIVPPPGVPVAPPQPGEVVPPTPVPEQNGATR